MNRLNKQQNCNITQRWYIIIKVTSKKLPKHLILNNRNTFDKKTIANNFNEYFVNVRLKLVSEISQSKRSFEMYLEGCDSSFEEVMLSDEEIKTGMFSLKGGKILSLMKLVAALKSKILTPY